MAEIKLYSVIKKILLVLLFMLGKRKRNFILVYGPTGANTVDKTTKNCKKISKSKF